MSHAPAKPPPALPRILVVFGTRPEAIKLAPVILALAKSEACCLRLCSTGQHCELLDQALTVFGLEPDSRLGLMEPDQDLGSLAARVMAGVAREIAEYRPDWLLVQGDTTTAMAAALAGFQARLAVAHVEAGLRSNDLSAPWPEELNRRVVSLAAALHFAPTAQARDNLLAEGVAGERVHVTGNTVIDALLEVRDRLAVDAALRQGLAARFAMLDSSRRLLFVTGHRRESFGTGMEGLCQALAELSQREGVEIAFPVHPNPHVLGPVRRALAGQAHIHLLPPLEYPAFVYLMDRAHLIISDSGGVQEEAPSLGRPVLVTREVTERPEAIAAGTARLVGTDAGRIVAEAVRLLDDDRAYAAMVRTNNPFGDGQAAGRIAGVLLGPWISSA